MLLCYSVLLPRNLCKETDTVVTLFCVLMVVKVKNKIFNKALNISVSYLNISGKQYYN